MSARDDLRGSLKETLEGPGPSLTLLRGGRGMGKTTLLRRVLGKVPEETRVVRHACAPVTDPDQRAQFARAAAASDADGPEPAPDDWPTLLAGLAERLDRERRPLVVALDDAHHALSARHRVGAFLEELWSRARAHALPLHLVLAGTVPDLDRELERGAPDLRRAVDLELSLEPLGLREVAARVPGYTEVDRLRTWAVFGGVPDRVRRVDPSVTLATNVRQLLLEPDGPLVRGGIEALEGEVQSPARYASLLGALASGARDWGGLRRACPAFETGSQMAPYVARLESLGLVEVRRSLDASPGGRNRRYELSDPFLAFWYRFVLPRWSEISLAAPDALWSRWVRPGLDAHVELVFPRACREWLLHDGDRVLPERGRVVGGLWGPDYDFPVAGTLRNGAVVYGTCAPGNASATAQLFDEARRQIRATRYGFGREGRHRVLFSRSGFEPDALRRAARDRLHHVVDLADLVGATRTGS